MRFKCGIFVHQCASSISQNHIRNFIEVVEHILLQIILSTLLLRPSGLALCIFDIALAGMV